MEEIQGFLSHVTGLPLFHIKHLPLSIFSSFKVFGSVPCIVLGIELADKNVFKKLQVFSEGNVRGDSFRPHEKYKHTRETFWCRNLQKRQKSCDCSLSMNGEEENLDDCG